MHPLLIFERIQKKTKVLFKIPVDYEIMFQQQFLNAASAQLTYMSTDELREIFADDDKLDERTDQIVSLNFLCEISYSMKM